MATTYECVGYVCGSCGHAHRTLSGAERCLERHHAGCASQGGYSDRYIVRSDGQRMTETDEGHYMDEDDVAREMEDEYDRLAAMRAQRYERARVTVRGTKYVVYCDEHRTWAVLASDWEPEHTETDSGVDDPDLCAEIAAAAGIKGMSVAGSGNWVDAAVQEEV